MAAPAGARAPTRRRCGTPPARGWRHFAARLAPTSPAGADHVVGSRPAPRAARNGRSQGWPAGAGCRAGAGRAGGDGKSAGAPAVPNQQSRGEERERAVRKKRGNRGQDGLGARDHGAGSRWRHRSEPTTGLPCFWFCKRRCRCVIFFTRFSVRHVFVTTEHGR